MNLVPNGFLVIDKPIGWTSHQVVGCVRSLLGRPKVGHTGTLDPFATGVLVLALSKATRWISFLPEEEKLYEAVLSLGTQTDTADLEGSPIKEMAVPQISDLNVDAVMEGFIGDRMQKPPMYSAIKKDGKPLYKYARQGIEVEVKSRPIKIHQLRRVSFSENHLCFQVKCSRGTYVRTLGEEIAQSLGTVGHLVSLKRISSGNFHLDQALGIEELSFLTTGSKEWEVALRASGRQRYPRKSPADLLKLLAPHILPIGEAFSAFPKLEVSRDEAKKVRNGIAPWLKKNTVPDGCKCTVYSEGELLALAEIKSGRVKLLRVLPVQS